MLYWTIVRGDLIRLGLDASARLITFDEEPTSAPRSRNEHLRNGLGALVSVSSDVGLQRKLTAFLWHARRDPARSELLYGLSELRRAKPWSSSKRFARRHALGLQRATFAAGFFLGARASDA
jgi:hypothetical protein